MATQRLQDPVHFIGIGGTGMSGLAEHALGRGYEVQGSDVKSSPMVERLAAAGARITLRHDADAIGTARTIVYSSAIGAENVELAAARRDGLKVLHRSDFLCHLLEGKQAITVAGTHGKSTTSAMITHVLDHLGCDPSAAVGGILRAYDSTARLGKGPSLSPKPTSRTAAFSSTRRPSVC